MIHIIGFMPIYNKNSKVLIVGTHPSPDGYNKGMYYSSKYNAFWKLLDSVLETDFCSNVEKLVAGADNSEEIEKIKQKLFENEIALCDSIKECDGEGTDDKISNAVLRTTKEIEEILKSSQIKTIFFTSQTAMKYFKRIFSKNGKADTKTTMQTIMAYMNLKEDKEPIMQVLYSPSQSFRRCGKSDSERLTQWKVFLTRALFPLKDRVLKM